jgi:rRNA pseudouridine-1189 N-methylase Emg1 (Nep1/Mra1 family)
LSLHECLKMEYRLAYSHLQQSDLFEGVRALLLDKDNKPNWSPKTLAQVDDKHVDHFFQPISEDDEIKFEERGQTLPAH